MTVPSTSQLRETPMDSLPDLAERVPGLQAGGMLGDSLAARVAFTYTDVDGFVHSILAGHPDLEGVDQYGLRLSTVYRVSGDLELPLRFSRSRQAPRTTRSSAAA